MATLEQSPKIYVCCGQYIATTKACKDLRIKCPKCNKYLENPITLPKILIVKK